MKKDYNPELPPGFLEACYKYPDFKEDSIQNIWDCLATWKGNKERWPNRKNFHPFATREEFVADLEEDIAEFKARILKAVDENDRPYVLRLWKAMGMRRPEPLMNGVKAAIDAFLDFMWAEMRHTKDQWPTKREIKQRVEAKLKRAGQPLPSERQWARIYRRAGLSALPKAPRARNQKG